MRLQSPPGNLVYVEFFDKSKLLALLKAIDLDGNEVLTAEGLAWGDGTITYDLVMQALIRHYSREECLSENPKICCRTTGPRRRSARLY